MDLVTGEPLALDLLNTLTDEYDALDDVQPWLELQAGRLTAPSLPLTDTDLAAVRALREHVRAAVDAVRQGRSPAGKSIEAVNQAVRAAPPYRILGADLGAVIRRDGDERARLLAQLAEAAVELLTGPDVGRIRACEGPRCRMLFVAGHPRRRWCSPALCGNRVRVARHYQRRRGGGSGAG
ncbi:CGNR zinc finger domain-containing protein [Nonomuraea sp. ZG12]|uniref:CGNR zinc finger domain-containing protein n=1 Tax=Nonomuraea sp. ZG12 TaxID=3452207 RepID=UPI003F8A89F8